MKWTIFSIIALLFLLPSCQKDSNPSSKNTFDIQTDMGLKRVSNTQDGKAQIVFNQTEWSTIENDLGLNMNKRQTQSYEPMKICIRISSRKKDCNGGVGFRCGVFDCSIDDLKPSTPTSGLSRERVQPVKITQEDGQVVMEFQNQLDWTWLSEN